jgi:hypothetical protein
MNKNSLLITVLMIVHLFTYAQIKIRNGNFEDWQNVGNNTEEPVGWNSNRTGGGNAPSGPQTCFRATGPNSGTYCARVRSGNTLGIVVNGSLTTGKVEAPSFNKESGYIRSIPTDTSYRMPFTGRPDSLVFWLKYTPQGSDRIRLEARLHVGFAYAPEAPFNNNHPDSTQNIIARAQFLSNNTNISSWTRFSLPFVYVDARTPQYILVTMTPSHDQTAGTNGSEMFIDDIQVVYNPVVGNVNTNTTYYVSQTTGTNINVPFSLIDTFNTGNTITAQLSDANGSFANPLNIGSIVTTTGNGTINANIPANTASGTGYKIRVVSNNPSRISNNTSGDLTVVLINAAITPASSQSILAGVNGNILTVTENFTATSREWKYSTTSGTGYQSFTTAETGATYTPNFVNNGNYYVVVESELNGLTTLSNEVEVSVNSITLTTNAISPAIYNYDLSASSGNINIDVDYTTSGNFNIGNEFTAQLSDGSGSFSNPLNIGNISSITSGTIATTLPNTLPSGLNYRVRVIASDPAIFGNDNGTDILLDQFSNSISPNTDQQLLVNESGSFYTVNESQNVQSREWRYSNTSGTGYQSFSPTETSPSYTPLFSQAGDYYIVCASTNSFGDEVISNEVLVGVTISVGIDGKTKDIVRVWNSNNNFVVDITNAELINPTLSIISLDGKEVLNTKLQPNIINTIWATLANGIYTIYITDNNKLFTLKKVVNN